MPLSFLPKDIVLLQPGYRHRFCIIVDIFPSRKDPYDAYCIELGKVIPINEDMIEQAIATLDVEIDEIIQEGSRVSRPKFEKGQHYARQKSYKDDHWAKVATLEPDDVIETGIPSLRRCRFCYVNPRAKKYPVLVKTMDGEKVYKISIRSISRVDK